MLAPLVLADGLFKNATPQKRVNRWVNGNLVRWFAGSVRPIGGWSRLKGSGVPVATVIADPSAEAVRDMYSWRALDQTRQLVLGSNLGLTHVAASGAVTALTLDGYVPFNPSKDTTGLSAYGTDPYGDGPYGVPNVSVTGNVVLPDRWAFTVFGEVLIMQCRNNGAMYDLNLSDLSTSVIANAPVDAQDVLVTDQRQVIAIGGDGQPRRLQASEVEDRTNWTPAVENQVVDHTLSGNGKLLRCVNVLGQVFILGETDAHVATYIGPPYVYSFQSVGTKCGPLAAEALVATDRFVVWWGARNFWRYDGTLQPVPCEVTDFLDKDVNYAQAAKISAFSNVDYGEIWWLYQSLGSTTGETDSYVVWDFLRNTWNTGRIDRTAGIDKEVNATPVMVSPNGALFVHEEVGTMPEGEVFVETGTLEVQNGMVNMALSAIYPDSDEPQDLTFTLYAKQFPNSTEFSFGPYPYDFPTNTRVLGRSIRLRADFKSGSAELGTLRLDVVDMGTGRR